MELEGLGNNYPLPLWEAQAFPWIPQLYLQRIFTAVNAGPFPGVQSWKPEPHIKQLLPIRNPALNALIPSPFSFIHML